ncbi:MAG: chemotaxis protein CheA [Succinivibrionaceae bacterium]|nr:chemotaxis protein CheA [Succinivibrionaceae bacterium]
MAYEGVDEEILQDFIVEAGEIIETLSEQLVQLEKTPDDHDLLNAIFRGFHTVKGGAGFINLANLVSICHAAENVFDSLRNGKISVSPELMDVVLKSHDVISEMFSHVQNKEDFDPPPQELLVALKNFASGAAASKPAAPAPKPAPKPAPAPKPEPKPVPKAAPVAAAPVDPGEDITEDEFEALLDQLHGKGHAPGAGTAPSGDPTDDEFERMLDGVSAEASAGPAQASEPVREPETAPAHAERAVAAAPVDPGEDITEDEFEALLDKLHGKGHAPGTAEDEAVKKTAAAPSSAQSASGSDAPQPASAPKAASKAPAKPAASPTADTTVRVDTKILDNIMNMVGELVLVRNRLISIGANSDDDDLSKAVSNLDVVTADLQGAVMKTRMQQVKKVFGRFPRVVRDLARNLKKEIELVMVGEDTDLDKNLVDALADPMVHLVRNSCDHGIELPEERIAAGKPAKGQIRLEASQEGDHILLRIIDDGAGMDAEKLKSVAIKKGLITPDAAAKMSDQEAYQLVCLPGFSTNTVITDISGRGVGMDVVKTSIAKLNGSLQISSKLGVGTTMEIKVPLTLAILPTLMVSVGGQSFALPLTSVNEIFQSDLSQVKIVDGQATIVIREKAIALFYLQDWLIRDKSKVRHPKKGHVVIVQVGHQQVGFVVDGLIGQEEVVIKPLDDLLKGTPGMAGATITSDGGIALIIDVPNLLKQYAHRQYKNMPGLSGEPGRI